MNTFNLKKNLETINAYFAKHYTKSDIPARDFYNFYTGKITCGKCSKTLTAWKALFHFHFK